MAIELIRHGPKNNNPEAHLTGVEADLDPSQIWLIKLFAQSYLRRTLTGPIQLETTPVPRSINTGNVILETWHEHPEFRDLILPIKVNELIGHLGIDPEGNAINLGPKSMTKVWEEGKRNELLGQSTEGGSLLAWLEQGLDNVQARDKNDPGISIREIACRVGSYLYSKLDLLTEKGMNTNLLSIGHSGDIEPWLYLTLASTEGNDIGKKEVLREYFDRTGGALAPLSGVRLSYSPAEKGIILTHNTRSSGGEARTANIIISPHTLREQALWLESAGRSQEVLAQKLARR